MRGIMRLLTLLADTILPPRETEAFVRDLTFERLVQELSPVCRGEGPQAAVSLFPYAHPLVEACILEAKFQGNRNADELLGRALREFLHEFLAESSAFETSPPIIVPLPLSAARYAERGYNQVERVVQAALAGNVRAECVSGVLIRTRETQPQTSLTGAARRTNVAGAFAASGSCDPYRTYILVDDVITTGNTMLAACAAMRAGGAARLLPLTLAY